MVWCVQDDIVTTLYTFLSLRVSGLTCIVLQEFTATSTFNDSVATVVKAAYKTKGYSFSSSILPDGKVSC